MKKILTIGIILISSASLNAQEKSPKVNEFGLTISRFSFENIPFDLVYKNGRDNKFWRLEASYLGGNFDFPTNAPATRNYTESRVSVGGGLTLAREYRKPLNDRLKFFHGPSVGVSGNYAELVNVFNYDELFPENGSRSQNLNYSVSGQLGYLFGCMIDLSDHVYLSFDLTPSIFFTYRESMNRETNYDTGEEIDKNTTITRTTGFNFTQGAASFGVFYRF